MYDLGVPVSVVIDDFLPIISSWGTNEFANTSSDKELWPILVEKAFGKLNANYASIVGGMPSDAIQQLLGAGGNWYETSTKTADAVFTDILNWTAAGYLIGTGTPGTNTVPLQGMIGNHAYSVFGAWSVTGTYNGVAGSFKIIKVRNPWGDSEWTGAFNDADPFWAANPTIATQVGFLNKINGDFFISA